MSRIKWDQIGEREFEVGVDHGVLYPLVNGTYPMGVAWNGLITVSDSPSGAENTPLYADNMKYLVLKSAEEFGGTIECYSYPDEWAACNGEKEVAPGVMAGQQERSPFGFAYRTKVGNDVENENYGYKLHLWYGCLASPSERSYGTVNDSPEAITFSYEITSTPVAFEGFKPVSAIVIDSTKVDSDKLAALEEILYGKDANSGPSVSKYINESDTDASADSGVAARLPLPDEIKMLFAA